jgi:PAS domain S-box-containing protein
MDDSNKASHERTASKEKLVFANVESEMADLINNFNWKESKLGSIKNWPNSLLASVHFILSSNLPLGIYWGKDLVLIYNDSWRKFIGDKHPNALGKTAIEVFPEIWELIGPQLERVMSGEGFVGIEDQRIMLDRNKGLEETWFDCSFSPIPLPDGSIGGVLNTATEKTNPKRHQQEIERLLIERTTVMDNLMEALTLADPSGKVFYQNKAALRLHGYETPDDAELPKYLYSDNWEVRDLKGVPVPVENWPMPRALSGESFKDYEMQISRSDKNLYFIGNYSGELVRDEDGTPLFAMLIIRDVTEQHKAEVLLKNERELLQTIFDRIPIMLMIYDPQLEQFSVNKHLTRLTGWTTEDIEKTSIMELTYPEPNYREQISKYMKSLKPGFKDINMATKDGRVLETSWANVNIPDGRQVGIGINISERKKTERALQRYLDRIQFLHEVDEGILAAHSEGEIVQAVVHRLPEIIPDCIQASVITYNFEQRTLTQLVKSGQKQSYINETFPMRDDEFWGPIHDSLREGKPFVVKSLDILPAEAIALKSLDSSEDIKSHIYYPIIINKELVGTLNLGLRTRSPLSAEQTEIVTELLVPLSIGIEQTRLHERALEINRRLFETIINNIPVAVSLIRGNDLQIIFANPTYYAITPGKKLIGSTLNEIWDDTEYDYLQICKDILKTDEPFLVEDDEVILHRTPDSPAEKTFFSWWLFPIDIPDEQEKGILNMAYETTDRKLAEMALVEAERLTTIGRMAASLAHEINNPLQSVVGCMGLAMEMMEEGEDASQFMDVAMEELIRASQIVKRMRDMGRSEKMEKKPGHVEDDLQKVILLVHKQAEDQQIQVTYEVDEDLPEIIVASDQIRQVFLNLILNAIESMPDGGNLDISISKSKYLEGIQIRISDTGTGIHPEELDKIFEAFHSNKQSGLGLGLYISRRIILSHNGKIEVESEFGKGTTFTLWLPVSG